TIWGVRRVPGRPLRELRTLVEKRVLSFLMVLFAGGLLIVSLVASAVIRGVAGAAGERFPVPPSLVSWLDNGVSFALLLALLTVTYRLLPDVEIRWRDVWPGVLFT